MGMFDMVAFLTWRFDCFAICVLFLRAAFCTHEKLPRLVDMSTRPVDVPTFLVDMSTGQIDKSQQVDLFDRLFEGSLFCDSRLE